jgi:hypothetical protein
LAICDTLYDEIGFELSQLAQSLSHPAGCYFSPSLDNAREMAMDNYGGEHIHIGFWSDRVQ